MADNSAQPTDEVDTASEALDPDIGEIWESLGGMLDSFVASLPRIGIAIVVFIFFIFLSIGVRWLILRFTKHHRVKNAGEVFARLSRWALVAVGLVIAVTIIAPSITPAKLLTTLGIGGIAIGFAFKDILQNFLAGILILIQMPFDIGDQIRVNEFEGTIEKIETRSTLIRTYDGREVIIPNSVVFTNSVVVNTAKERRRSEYDIGIGYADSPAEAAKALKQAIQSVEGVSTDPGVEVLMVDIAGSSLNLRVRWWTKPDRKTVLEVQDRVLRQIKITLDDAEIDIPYSTHMVLFHDQTEEFDGDRTKQREGWPAGDTPPRPARLANSGA